MDGRVFARCVAGRARLRGRDECIFYLARSEERWPPVSFIGDEIGATGDRAKPPYSGGSAPSGFSATGYKGAAEQELVVAWIAFYGLALLSTGLFAPRSLVCLGWAFLLTALALPAMRNAVGDLPANLPNIAMGITFGLYHLIYAVCAWPRKRADEIEQFAVE